MAIDFQQIPSPCYVLDEQSLQVNLEILKIVQEEAGVDILCALKGFAMWKTFPIVGEYLAGGAASSLHEARLIFEEMGREAHTYCPAFQEHEFNEIMLYSSHLVFNSLSQWEKFGPLVKLSGKPLSCGIRVNPEYSEVETDLYNPAGPFSRLGVRSSQLGESLPTGIEGLHFHALCEQDSKVLERTLAATEKKFGHLIQQAKWFNMGGGHHITREGYDVEHLIQLLVDFKTRYPNLEKVILEPGEAIGWQTGYLTSTVLDIIDHEGFKTAMLDVSFTAHMPDCLEMPYKPKVLGATDAKEGKTRYRLGGLSCLAGDFMGMGDYSFDHELKIGDKIVFDDMIHYTMVKTSFFNGVNHPSIGVWTKDQEFVLLQDFGYEDYKNKL